MTTLDFVAVPVPAQIFNEFIHRKRDPKADVIGVIHDVLQDFLDRTRGDSQIWSDEHAEEIAELSQDAWIDEFGERDGGYRWLNVFLPNGTEISMKYKGKNYLAHVKHESIVFGGEKFTPAEFARKVASNTARNAWRDLYVRRPGDKQWTLADSLRRSSPSEVR